MTRQVSNSSHNQRPFNTDLIQVILEFNDFNFGFTRSQTLISHPGTEQYNLLNLNTAEKPSKQTTFCSPLTLELKKKKTNKQKQK